jgi:hypothetical protein
MSPQLSSTARHILEALGEPRRRGWAFLTDLRVECDDRELDCGLGELARLGKITIVPGRDDVLIRLVGW